MGTMTRLGALLGALLLFACAAPQTGEIHDDPFALVYLEFET